MLRLALLWHMHQPYYEDLASGEHILPWVRLHALKDYVGMVSVLREFPGVRATFNLVPSLLVQVQAFAEERAHDRLLELSLRPADALNEDDRAFLVVNGFHAPVERMIRPYPRYAQLFTQRHEPSLFTDGDLRDLQIWHKLAWMDPDWLVRDARLKALVGKDRGFDETDKAVLRDVELELLRAVIPAYGEAAAAGQVELSTSPFYHPILPLLCDSDSHFAAHPHSSLQRGLFRRPEDARLQLERARDLHARLFGERPRGVWPSEGSVSDATIALMADLGFSWVATDEEVLARSLRRAVSAADLYRAYEVGADGATVRCLFRDHGLSDLIGFAYQSWRAEAAADDFLAKVRDAGRRFGTRGETPTVSVILDGENAWEHYEGGGRPFLRALYTRLASATDIETVTMAEAAGTSGSDSAPAKPERLERIFPGSWINGDFYIWAGHTDDHRAWSQLAAARAAFDELAPTVSAEARARAREELLIAEGSDWFWWYGDDHSSNHDREFDDLFRRHLRNVYRALGRTAPDQLHASNISTAPVAAGNRLPLTTFISPDIDGQVTRFGEWSGAVLVPPGGAGGAMHRVTGGMIDALRVGVSRTELFLLVQAPEFVARRADGLQLVLLLHQPRALRLPLSASPDPTSDGGQRVRVAIGSVLEAAVPFTALGVQAADRMAFDLLVIDRDGQPLEQHPALQPVELDVPTRHLTSIHWSV